MMAVKLLVNIAVMMMVLGGTPVPPEVRGREPPSSSYSSLTFSLDGRRVSPLVHGLHGVGGARAPPRLDLSLCLSPFLRSLILPFHRFLNSRRSVTPIGLNFGHDFYPDIGFLVAKEGHQPPYGVATRAQGAPPASCPPRASSRVDSSSQKSHIFQKKSPSVFIPFGLRLIWVFSETKTCNKQELALGTGSIC